MRGRLSDWLAAAVETGSSGETFANDGWEPGTAEGALLEVFEAEGSQPSHPVNTKAVMLHAVTLSARRRDFQLPIIHTV
jgi:hypothetical protein